MRSLLIVMALAACGDDGNTTTDGRPGDGSGSAVNPLEGIGTVEMVAGGFMFTEGPQWREAQGVLLFSDIPASTIFQYTPGGGAPTVFRMPSSESNGLAIDQNGAVISAQHNNHTVARDAVEIVAIFENQRLNSPNDVTVDTDGTIYFTDPPYGLPPPPVMGQPFVGVFRITPSGEVFADYRGALTERPNGIGLSLDSKTLYVDDTDDGKLYGYPIGAGGVLGTRTMVAMTSGNPDGLAIDAAGNIFVATMAGIDVFAPSGTKWGTIAVPMQPTNCGFGDTDHKTLYITAQTTLYKVRLANPGMPRR